MKRRESRNELLEKWRIEKGKPPRPEKPWLPVRKPTTTGKCPDEGTKPPPHPENSKIVHTNFLKRRSGLVKWSHLGYYEDAKRRCFSFQSTDKENVDLDSSATVNIVVKTEELSEKPTDETLSVEDEAVIVKKAYVVKTRRELLSEWKKVKQAPKISSEVACGVKDRQKTISVIAEEQGTVSKNPRGQTTTSEKPKGQDPPSELCVKESDQFKKSNQSVSANLRRQTMVIKSKFALCNERKASSTNLPAKPPKSSQLQRCASQPILKRQKLMEIPPGSKVGPSLPNDVGSKREEPKTAAGTRVALRTNNARVSLGSLHREAKKDNGSNHIVALFSTKQAASKGVMRTAKNIRPVFRNCVSAPILAPVKTPMLQSKPAINTAALQAKSINRKNVKLQAQQTATKGTKVTDIFTNSKSPLVKSVASRSPARRHTGVPSKPVSSTASKAGDKASLVKQPKVRLSLKPVVHRPKQVVKSPRKSQLGILKPSLKTPSNRKNVAFMVSTNGVGSFKSPSLRRRVSSWLEMQGHTPSAVRHLHCLGVELSEVKKKLPLRSRSCGAIPRVCSLQTTPNARSDLEVLLNPHNILLAGRTQLRIFNNEIPSPYLDLKAKSHLGSTTEESPDVETGDKMQDFQEALSHLSILLDNCYPLQQATEWLDAMFEKTQNVCQLRIYWECRAKISELSNNPDEALALLERGANCDAQAFDYFLKMRPRLSKQTPDACLDAIETPKSRRQTNSHIDADNVFSSTLIKYVVRDQAPVSNKLWPMLRGESSASLVTVTPVRRTQRRSSCCSTAFTPASALKGSSVQCVTSLADIPDELKRRMVLLPNPSLKMWLESPRYGDDQAML